MENTKTHGISIGIKRVNENFFIVMKIVGSLTHEDYKTITPMIEKSLESVEHPNISLLVDATEFKGWSLEAAFDDLKIGLKHNSDFKKIAFVGSQSWQEYGIKITNWFISANMEYFENTTDAIDWLSQDDEKEKIEEQQLKSSLSVSMTEKEIDDRKEAIEGQLELLFKTNMKITDWDVPEADDRKAAELIAEVLQNKLDNIKQDISDGKYDNY